MRRSFTLLTLLLCTICSRAQTNSYNVDLIPDSLKNNANAVVRMFDQKTVVHSKKQVVTKITYAVTVLNKMGKQYEWFVRHTSPLTQVVDAVGVLYNKKGERLRSTNNFKTAQLTEEPGFYDDVKTVMGRMADTAFPYTVEYTFEIHQDHSFGLPLWNPMPDGKISLQSATLTVDIPRGDELVYYGGRYSPQVRQDKRSKLYTWQANGICAPDSAAISLLATERPEVLYTLAEFKLKNYSGSCASWRDFGKFMYELNEGRDQLPAAEQDNVVWLTKNARSRLEAITLLYKYLQEQKRYVSVSTGISGWQTMEASAVIKKGYGDCKALVYYMKGMLHAIHINSYPVLVRTRANDSGIVTAFPFNQFDHVILAVPHEKDTLWLECTDREAPVNFLGEASSNRYGLLITPEGGNLVRTRSYDSMAYSNTRMYHVTMTAGGDLSIQGQARYHGDYGYFLLSEIADRSKKEQEARLKKLIKLKSFSIASFDYQNLTDISNVHLNETIALTAKGQVTTAGSSKLVNLNVAPLFFRDVEFDRENPQPFEMPYSIIFIDTVDLVIPDGMLATVLPKTINERSSFGSISSESAIYGNVLQLRRKVEMRKGRYEPGAYDHYQRFIAFLRNDANYSCVLNSK